MANAKTEKALLDLGRNTIISVCQFGEVVDRADGGGNMQVDYTIVQRGTLSTWSTKKRLARYLLNNLVIAVAKDPRADGRYSRESTRAGKWNTKHVRVFS